MSSTQRFEILPQTADIRIKAMGATRAGLLIAAVKGMSAATGPRLVEKSKLVERKFDVSSPDFPSLLVDVLNEAATLSDTNKETYEDVKFSLITDKQAQGFFIGRPVSGFATRIKAATHQELDVKKNELDQWEATIVFDV